MSSLTKMSSTSSQVVFFVNGMKVIETKPEPEMTLLCYLRNNLGLSGSKLGCGEGGCGACTVMLSKYDHTNKKILHISANACLTPVCAVDGMAVTTVEGIGSTKTQLHPVQERLAKSHGSQCGFCTPGIVMSMYTLLRNKPVPSQKDLESAFEGNLCRCTGYRPIMEGFQTFTKEFCCGKGGSNGCCMDSMNNNECNDINAQKQGTMNGTNNGTNNGTTNGTTNGITNGTINGYDEEQNSSSDEKHYKPYDPTQEPIFPPELMLTDLASNSLHVKGERVEWFRPSTLSELLQLKKQYPQAKLVIGNTEVGIEVKYKNLLYPVIIAPTHVPELNEVQESETGIWFGASVTLSTLDEVLHEAVNRLPEYKTRVFSAIIEILRWFAGHQIRNVAAVGGNIMTASPISDLNPIFMASGAILKIAVAGGQSREMVLDEKCFVGYRRTSILPEEVLLGIHIPFTKENEHFFAYKQARRRDDDIAIVNAGLRVLLEKSHDAEWKVKDCGLSFGGMAAVTVLAKKTMEALIGRSWNDSIVSLACEKLAEDLPLAAGAPGGQVEFRRSLTTSFFFKFYLTVSSKINTSQVPDSCKSATQFFHRQPTKSVQTFQEVPVDQDPDDMVGRSMMHLAAAKQVCGEAVYVDDMPKFANELYLGLVLSQRPHAKILSVDASEALSMPGVKGFVSVEDVPGDNMIGPVVHDEQTFASGEVTCVGQVIAGIVADTQVHAQRAAKAVKVEYEDLEKIISIEDAIAAKSYFPRESTIEKGNIEAGFAEADHILQGEMKVGGQEHFYLETQATIAVPKGEDGEMELFVSTQNPAETQHLVAVALGVPSSHILVRVKRMGGGFGGKETRNLWLSCATAVAAEKMGCPVRCMLDRDEDMMTTGTRHGFLGKYKVGFTKTGKLLALDVQLYSNAGNSTDLSFPVIERAMFHSDNCYLIPNVRAHGRVCKTNIPSNTAFRGFGGPQGMMIAEYWISDVARVCGISQAEVRARNLYSEGDLTHYNQKLEQCHIKRIWKELVEKSDYETRRQNILQFNKSNRWKKRGIHLTPTKFGIAFTALFMNQAGALVHVYKDGSVLLTHGGTEMGQGLHTKMIQVAAKTLMIPVSKIHISETGTNTVPNTSPTAASASSDLNGMAVKIACEKIKENIAPFRKSNPDGKWEDWVNSAYFSRISLSANGFYRTPGIGYNFETNTGRAFNYLCYGAACSEVEIDCLTGDHQVLRTDIVMDVGRSLNPAIDIGQVEGGFVQGLGLFTIEELRYSQRGTPFTIGPGTYKIPGFADIPVEFNVHLLRSAPNDKAVFSSKAVGEPPLFLASSVFYAIKEAIYSAREDAGVHGIFKLDSPATSERIRMACEDQFTKQFPPSKDPAVKDWNVYI